MLDWREITAQIQHAETLSLDDLMAELAELRTKSPETGDEVTRYFARNRRVSSFMETSAPPGQQTNTILPNGSVLGVWEILDLIGSGGMGDVYKARRNDGLYDQEVALKVIQRRDADSLSRFEEERKRLATLEHPGISRIIDGGATEDGSPFMVMEYVEGRFIDDHISAENLSRNQSLSLFKSLCASVTHAHSKLILHRDIKTTNVLVDATGSVKLIDFGIASVIGETADGHGGPMTIAYAAPEQLMGKPPAVGSDIFALGVLLHQILTGAHPQRNPDGGVTAEKTLIGEEDLFAIVSKATAFEAEDRYKSVTAFADDIDAYLDNRPVLARNGTGTYRLKKLVKRNLLASALAAGFVVALSGGMITSLVMANKATAEAVRANAELERAEWNMERTSIMSMLSASAADSFRYIVGKDDNSDLVAEHLVGFLEDAPENLREKYPQKMASNTFVVGKYFLDQNDYLKAKEIFEPWVSEGYGPSGILAFGQISLGFAYMNLGETENAIEMFKKSEAYYLGTPEENTIEHAAAAIQVALLSSEKSDLARAADIINHVLLVDENQFNRVYLMGKLYEIEKKSGNQVKAYEALAESIKMAENGEHGGNAGQDSMYLQFAAQNIFYKRDFALADTYIQKAEDFAGKYKAEDQIPARVHELRAAIFWHDTDFGSAISHSRRALELSEKNTGHSPEYAEIFAQLGILQADSGDITGAEETLLEMRRLNPEFTKRWLDLVKLHIVAHRDGIAAAQVYFGSSALKQTDGHRRSEESFYLSSLVSNGLKL